MTGSLAIRTIVVMLLWALCFPLISIGINYSPHLTFATLRGTLAGSVLIALAISLNQSLPKQKIIWLKLIAIGIGATTLGFLGMFHAAEFVSPGIATVIANTQPILAAVLASIFLREHLGTKGKCGLVLGFLGIVLIASPDINSGNPNNYLLGIGYIGLAAFGISLSNVLIKQLSGSVDMLMAMGIQMLIGSIPLGIAAWATEHPQDVIWSPAFIFALFTLSILGTSLVYWLWFSILTVTPLSRASSFSFLIPVFGISLGILFYGETLGTFEVIGTALTILGIAFTLRK